MQDFVTAAQPVILPKSPILAMSMFVSRPAAAVTRGKAVMISYPRTSRDATNNDELSPGVIGADTALVECALTM